MNRRKLIAFVALVAFAALSGDSLIAQNKGGGKKGGGGDKGGATPPGTIYFVFEGRTWTMNGDGKNRVTLPAEVHGDPSHALHGDKRWFLQVQNGELVAIRDDGGSQQVQLTPSGDGVTVRTINYGITIGGRWAKNDSFVSYIGIDGAGNQAIYRLDIAWSTGSPQAAAAPLAAVSGSDLGGKTPFLFDWSPSGTKIVFELREGNSNRTLHTKDLSTSLTSFLANGSDPNWSPNGSKIVLQEPAVHPGIQTINPDGTGLKTILASKAGRNYTVLGLPRWAPSSQHVVFSIGGSVLGDARFDTYRASAGGSGKTNLTSDLDTRILSGSTTYPSAWR